MTHDRSMNGWVGLAVVLMLGIGILDFFQGLIAIIRDDYYTLTPNQIIVFDLTTWGWITLVWGVIAILAALGLAAGQGWARWFTIIVAGVSFIEQLAFVGSSQYTLWALAVLVLTIMVLYALIVRWDDYRESAAV